MLATARPLETLPSLDDLQAGLRRRHDRIRDLRLRDGADGLEVDGETSTYHALQLLIRDVLALGIAPRVRVRVAVRGPRATPDPTPHRQPEPAPSGDRGVLIAAADTALLARCTARLARAGYQVASAATGLECLNELVTRPPRLLVLIGRLPWGGSSGVLHLAHEEGYLDRMAVAYLGDPGGLDGLSEALLGKLAQVRLASEFDDDAVCGVVIAGPCSCAG